MSDVAVQGGRYEGYTVWVTALLASAGTELVVDADRPDRARAGLAPGPTEQALGVIRRLVRDLNVPVEIVGCPTVREPDGLALSSRNAYLSTDERGRALVLSRTLFAVRQLFAAGERDRDTLVGHARSLFAHSLASDDWPRLDYLELRDAETLEQTS